MLDTVSSLTRSYNRRMAGTELAQKWLRTLPVADDLAALTDVDHKREVAAQEAGLSPQAVNAIWQSVLDMYCTGYYPALMLCVRRNGKVVLNRSIGHADGFLPGSETPARLATVNTPACLFSESKALTAMVMHKLAEDGLVDLLDPVAYYIPEFAANGKRRLNLYQILSHRGGVPGIPPGTDVETLVDHDAMLKLLCAAKPMNEDGRVQAYHALTGGFILQEVVERVTGDSLVAYWRKHFKQPMKMRFLDYGASRKDYNLMARDYINGAHLPGFMSRYAQRLLGLDVEKDSDLLNDYRFYAQSIPAGNMIGTAEEVSRFFQMLLDQGSYDGRQILQPRTVHRAVGEASPHRMDQSLKLPLRFSAGMMLGGEPFGLFGGRSERAFGHLGLVNNIAWADPQRNLSVALMATGKPLLAHNLPFFANVVRTISSSVPRVSGRR